jgi:transposase
MKNKRERTKEAMIKQCVKGEITARDAALRLDLSIRQVENLKKKYREGVSLLHGNCGRISPKALDDLLVQRIISEYKKVEGLSPNFTHFKEILEEKGIKVSYTALRSVLTKNGFESPKKRRKRKNNPHKTRERRQKLGELLQTDATPYDWFGDGNKYALHGLIDDATGRITALHMSENECMDGYLEIMRQTLEKYGTPEALYADGLSIFFHKGKERELTIDEQLSGVYERKTQFGDICDELGIELIHARSSQAKGRVERLWNTLQSRLPVEFGLRGIKDINAANDFLKNTYIDLFNEKFGVNADAASRFVTLPDTVNLDLLLSYKVPRKLDNGGVFSLQSVKFKVVGHTVNREVIVHISTRLGVAAVNNGRCLPVVPLDKMKKSIDSTDSVKMILSRFVFAFCLKNEHTA